MKSLRKVCPTLRTVGQASIAELAEVLPKLLPYDRPEIALEPDAQRLLVLMSKCEDECERIRARLVALSGRRQPAQAVESELHEKLCARGRLSGFLLDSFGKLRERLTERDSTGLLALRCTHRGAWVIFPELQLSRIEPLVRTGHIWTPAFAFAQCQVEGARVSRGMGLSMARPF